MAYKASVHEEFAASQEALQKLQADKDNPELNRIVGEYLCFSKGDWERGLPYLQRVDGPVGKLADLELSPNPTRDAMLEIADGWWALHEASEGLRARNIGLHAQFWYNTVLPQLSGLTEVRVRKRLDEARSALGAAEGPNALPGPNAVTKGHFTAWTIPANPQPGENYMIMVRIELPPNVKEYPLRDLSGFVEGTDRYRQPIGGRFATKKLPVTDGKVEVKIMVPGAAKLVRDKVPVRSAMLNEEQTLEIVF